MSKSRELAEAKARRLAAGQVPQAEVDRMGRVAKPAKPSTSRVRMTTDVDPVDHRAFKRWCDGAAEQLGRSNVAGQDVVRALLHRLLTDRDLARQVLADLAAAED